MIYIDPSNPKGIVWLASYPKSGNTWIRIFLSALLNIITGRGDKDVDLNRLDEFSLAEYSARFYRQFLDGPVAEATPAQIAAARPKVHRFVVDNSAGIIPLKTHNANVTLFGIPVVTPSLSAGAIYVVRNPLDVAISFARYRNISVDQMIADLGTSGFFFDSAADRVFELVGSWTEHVTTWTAKPHPALLVVRYEDMVDKPIETFGAIADHVLMTYTRDELAAAIERTSFDRLQAMEEREGFRERPATTERFFREGRAGQWREILSAEQVGRIVGDHGEQMRRFGYLWD